MLSFLARMPPRTSQAHLRTIHTEDGENAVEFLVDDDKADYGMKSWSKPGPTILDPPYHWHKYQTERFLVHSGTMRSTLEGQDKLISAGETIVIKPGLYHTYRNNSDTEQLIVSTGLDPSAHERDEAFFRNLYCYLDDCRKADMAPHIAQVCLFLYLFDCYLAIPGPRSIAKPLSQALVFLLGVVVGKWLLGYKEIYPEYYKSNSQ
ncbi:MAG: hypothetical protein Q9163_000112 [Psora crenata]